MVRINGSDLSAATRRCSSYWKSSASVGCATLKVLYGTPSVRGAVVHISKVIELEGGIFMY